MSLSAETDATPRIGWDDTVAVEPAELLLERLRADALKFLAEVPYPPRSLRLRVGSASLDLEWHAPLPAAPATPAAPAALPVALAAVPEPVSAPVQFSGGTPVRSPSVGVFYRCPEPGAAPFVVPGDVVRAGQQIGIVEVMKLMIPIETDREGTVLDVLKEDGASVEYDEPLIVLAPGNV